MITHMWTFVSFLRKKIPDIPVFIGNIWNFTCFLTRLFVNRIAVGQDTSHLQQIPGIGCMTAALF